ncbi:MAG: hypothetical protein JW943_06200 [Deltaproteobacteria bacterium]|nr:hypothetical protein [Deltaproteobacteria bacterium]
MADYAQAMAAEVVDENSLQMMQDALIRASAFNAGDDLVALPDVPDPVVRIRNFNQEEVFSGRTGLKLVNDKINIS